MTKNLQIINYNISNDDSDIPQGTFYIPNNEGNFPGCGADSNSTFLFEQRSYGAHYTWFTATAGQGTYNFSHSHPEQDNTNQSICPKSWKLPTSQEAKKLFDAEGGWGNLMQSPANFVLSGYSSGRTQLYSEHWYWTSSSLSRWSSSSGACTLYYGNTSECAGECGSYGAAVRCISQK